MAGARFESVPVDFDFLLRNYSLLEIAWYQRGYAWGQRDIDSFVSDVGKMSRRDNRHFFGSIIGVVNNSARGPLLELVDGQQRCTTIFLALAACAHAFSNVAKKTAKSDETLAGEAKQEAAELWEDLSQRRRVGSPKLQLSREDRDALSGIFEDERAHARSPVSAAYRRLRRELVSRPILANTTSSWRQKLDEVRVLRDHLRSGTEFILITSSRDADIYVLFESLNTRGKDLTHAELLRTRTMSLVSKHQHEAESLSEAWSTIVDLDRGKNNENRGRQFLQDFYNSHAGERASEHALLKECTVQFFDYEGQVSLTVARGIRDIVRRMSDAVRYLETWRRPTGPEWPYSDARSKKWVRDRHARLLSVLGHRAATPLILAARECLDEKQFSKLITDIELAAFRYEVCKGEPNKLSNFYIRMSKTVRDQAADFDLEKFKTDLWELVLGEAGDDDFGRAIETRLRYVPGNTRVNRRVLHFLTTLDQFDRNSGRFEMNTIYAQDLTDLEHIAPQSTRVGPFASEEYKHSIGNITFWGSYPNRAAQDDSFELKRSAYLGCNVKMTRKLAALTEWTPDAMRERAAGLAADAVRLWSFATTMV